MVHLFRVEWILVLGLTIGIIAGPGCALFPGSGMVGDPNNAGFHRTASTATNPVPLPVEIVSDISTIASGYGNPQDGVWKPVYPEVERKPATPEGSPQPATGNQAQAPQQAPAATGEPTEQPAAEQSLASQSIQGPNGQQAAAARTGKTVEYKVRTGDTLMKISFEKFGNIYRWREIYNNNRERIPNFNALKAGTVLTIAGVEYVVITRNGVPYLIRRGDTLGKISGKVYGETTKWRAIWKNNPELIRDPNKIYAGFTLYYVPSPTQQKPAPVKQVTTAPKLETPAAPAPSAEKAPASVESENSWVPAQ